MIRTKKKELVIITASIFWLALSLFFLNYGVFADCSEICTGKGVYCPDPLPGGCDANGFFCEVSPWGSCYGTYNPSSEVECVDTEEECTCSISSVLMLTMKCEKYCKLISYNVCNCAGRRSVTDSCTIYLDKCIDCNGWYNP